jgi:hypothetical protein
LALLTHQFYKLDGLVAVAKRNKAKADIQQLHFLIITDCCQFLPADGNMGPRYVLQLLICEKSQTCKQNQQPQKLE